MLSKEQIEEIRERVKSGDHGSDYYQLWAVADMKALLEEVDRMRGMKFQVMMSVCGGGPEDDIAFTGLEKWPRDMWPDRGQGLRVRYGPYIGPAYISVGEAGSASGSGGGTDHAL